MLQREGLSFSDYFDDSVPYEVKPVPSTIPMEEREGGYVGHSDIPTQSKDLFKGLWEVNDDKPRLRESEYWLDPSGNFNHAVEGHELWAEDYFNEKNIPYDSYDAYSDVPNEKGLLGIYKMLYDLKFMRVVITPFTIYVTNNVNEPTNIQLRNLKNLAIEYNKTLNIKNKIIDLMETKCVSNDTRSLFIESMMPENLDTFKTHLGQLFAYLQKELQLKTIPSVKLVSDEKNAEKVLGKTAYYNPAEKEVALFVTNRHQKDILRSFAHEIIHHWQHENEKLHEVGESPVGANDPQYAQKNPWLRQMEKQAYLLGNMLFRDWEDQKKTKDKKSGYNGKSPIPKKQKVSEKTYSMGNEYPPKKMSYKG